MCCFSDQKRLDTEERCCPVFGDAMSSFSSNNKCADKSVGLISFSSYTCNRYYEPIVYLKRLNAKTCLLCFGDYNSEPCDASPVQDMHKNNSL